MNMTSMLARWNNLALTSLLLMIAGSGCGDTGPRRAEVAGTVTLNERPISQGMIQFIPVAGNKGPETGAVISNGKFHIALAQGATVGRNRVELRASRKTGRKMQDPTAKPGILTDEFAEAFPPDFNTNSTLVREIKDGVNTLTFDIETK